MKTVTLREITLNITDGKHGDCEPAENSGYYFVSCKDVNNGTIDYANARQISERAFLETHKRTQLEPNDILITNSGTIGRMALVKDIPETYRTTFQKSVAIVKPDISVVLPTYLYYKLQNCVTDFVNCSNGSAQKNLLLGTMRKFQIDLHEDFAQQERLSSILAAYDNLIENNQKQIKLLEEAARRLYKEWFVDLRFPGYEDTPIVDGVPEGWKKCLLGDINCSLESGSRPKGGIDASLVDGVPSIGAENVIGLGCYNYSSEKLITKDFFSKMKRGKLCDKDILIYKDGAYIGRTSLFQDGFPHLEAAVNEHVFLLHAADEHIQYYLFFTLYQQEYYQKMQKLNKNAAQPGINSKAMMSLPVLLPTEDILDGFDSFATPLMHKIFNLAKQNRRLELARDRLLPKLMSGEIEV
jgi:type I restriction enzyme S subunit